jgi:L-alanine-DL-glutamate epimerase-like enolase superfamily enzyme
MIRKEFSPDDLELRVDANGAFAPSQALERLKWLSDFYIHSIEQPIRANQWEQMAQLCKTSPIAIALDEELIGFRSDADKVALLDAIQPQYIILKPSLCGGFNEADTWIKLAEDRHIGWWATSALESNIGLNAIAQWVANYHPTIPQGLGTGALYANNFSSPLTLIGENLWFTSNN